MPQRDSHEPLLDELKQAYDTYRRYSFIKDPPKKPAGDFWRLTFERMNRVYLGMSLPTVMLLRTRDYLVRHDVPFLPYLCEVLSIASWNVSIGRRVTIGPGVIFPHGHVIIDGRVQIGRDCVINPWVTIGLSGSRRYGIDRRGPTIGDNVYIGTGAKVLGPITVGDGARIGANSVVIHDVPAGATVVGAPARVVHGEQVPWGEAEVYASALRREKEQQT
jgi:serine O-acetyltransferase